MAEISSNLEVTLGRAIAFAKAHNHLSVGNEHLLLALTQDTDARFAFLAFRISTESLKQRMQTEVELYPVHQVADTNSDIATTPLSMETSRVLGIAMKNAVLRKQQYVDGVNVLLGILESDSTSTKILKALGMDVLSLSYWMQFGILEDDEGKLQLGQTSDNVGSNLNLLPHQSVAPVRIAEVAGRLVRTTNLDSSIDVDELDFDRWRWPVADGLAELLDADLGPGTNHERLRRRLLALAAALAGTIDDVKANQFRLGYGIESLGDLVGVYRTAADDMPTLNAAVFADVNRLHIQLMLGLSKLAAWSRFQQAADADELGEGSADPAAVGAALAGAEAVLAGEAAAPIVDPELPRSFCWIREAIADPATTTKRMVYGAVKSLENVGSFLGQLALRSAKEAAENAAQGISRRAAALLLTALSGALLQLSGALPTAWPWLKPLLEAAAKAVHG